MRREGVFVIRAIVAFLALELLYSGVREGVGGQMVFPIRLVIAIGTLKFLYSRVH